jgi:hypothetical protein
VMAPALPLSCSIAQISSPVLLLVVGARRQLSVSEAQRLHAIH